MTQFNSYTLIENLINNFYSKGEINPIIDLLADNAIGFSSHFPKYFSGKKQIDILLEQELMTLSPYQIINNEFYKSDNFSNILKSNFTLYHKNIKKLHNYNIIIMYEETKNKFCITGIHFFKIPSCSCSSLNNNFLLESPSLLYLDKLTGIYNKDSFYEKTQNLIQTHPSLSFEIMCLDIERFKIINEVFGIDIADELLLSIGNFFKFANIVCFTYGRLYADKFVLCYPAQNNNRHFFINSLNTIANNFRNNYKVILSFGVYSICNNNLPISIMCDKAILALKKSKGHYLVPYGEYDNIIYENLMNEQLIINNISTSLIHKEFMFYLQPKYDLHRKKIIGAEALIRWYHPQHGHIAPDKFIPSLETNGFILELDKYIWEEVCKTLKKWLSENKPLYPISINVSRIDLYDDTLVEFLQKLLEKYQLPTHLLELEITESAYINDTTQIIEITQKLQNCGFVIIMDDFGSGFSSLNMLKDISVDILKMDLKFLQNKNHPHRSKIIIRSIIQMAEALKLPVIIEGVETQEQADFLRSIGCIWIQGYYYSKPLSIPDYEKLLDTNI